MSRAFRYTGRFREGPWGGPRLAWRAATLPSPDRTKAHDLGCPALKVKPERCTCHVDADARSSR